MRYRGNKTFSRRRIRHFSEKVHWPNCVVPSPIGRSASTLKPNENPVNIEYEMNIFSYSSGILMANPCFCHWISLVPPLPTPFLTIWKITHPISECFSLWCDVFDVFDVLKVVLMSRVHRVRHHLGWFILAQDCLQGCPVLILPQRTVLGSS